MYDNVQESMECPGEDVLEDDDLLDGWFILQKKKQERDKLVSEVDNMTQNEKISQSEEIFLFTDNKDEADRINQANSIQGQMIKKSRMAQLKAAGGEINEADFQDRQLELQRMSNEQFKSKFRS